MDETPTQIRAVNAGMLLRTVAAIQDHCARIASQVVDGGGDFRLPDRGSVETIARLSATLDTDWRAMADSGPFSDKARHAAD